MSKTSFERLLAVLSIAALASCSSMSGAGEDMPSGTADTSASGSSGGGASASGGAGGAGGGGPPVEKVVYASRIFAGPNQYPPKLFAAYGILAFRTRASPYDRNRHMMICEAYIARLPDVYEVGKPKWDQMVTVWPVNSDEQANTINQIHSYDETSIREICNRAVNNYDLVTAIKALNDAQNAGVDVSGDGPFLLAWAPAVDKGKPKAPVLRSDLSDVPNYERVQEIFHAWATDIEASPDTWKKGEGWSVEKLRLIIREWADKFGPKVLEIVSLKLS